MNIEIERKYLVINTSFKQYASHYSVIKQGYLSTDKNRSVRIRVLEDKGFITIKGVSSADGLSRLEWEKEIPLSEALALFDLSLPGAIEKTRYFIPTATHTWEIDVFHADNEGLILAEIELSASNEKFNIPDFIGEEVTGDVRYYNAYLSQHPFKLWK